MDNNLTNKCYQKSLALLKKNSTGHGFSASSYSRRAAARSYLSIFSRDASICSLGAVASGDKDLIKTAKKSLETLARHQADNGQIPNYVKPEENYIDFWRIGCIDSTLWWLIALDFYHKNSQDKKLKPALKRNTDKALGWLYCQEHPQDKLLLQGDASDWADIFPRNGKVLYSNSLWYKVKKEYGLKNKEHTFNNFNNLFYPYNKKTAPVKCQEATIGLMLKKTKPSGHLFSFVNYLYWGQDIDVYGNSLAVVFDVVNDRLARKILVSLAKKRKIAGMPTPVLFEPIDKSSKYWRPYMESHGQNLPFQYHNGGIWPYAACFWAMALKKKYKVLAKTELEKTAYANSKNNWEFNEWFHARSGKAMGMRGQSWNAGSFLLAWHYINNNLKF